MLIIALYLVLVLAILVIALRVPEVVYAPMYAMFGLEQWAQSMSNFFLRHQSLTNIAVGLLIFVSVAIKVFRGGNLFSPFTTVMALVFGLYFYAFASINWAPRPDLSYSVWMKNGPYIIAIAMLSPLILSSVRGLDMAARSLLLLGGSVVVLILMFSTWEGRFIVLASEGRGGMRGGNPLTTAQLAGYVGFAALFLVAHSWRSLQLGVRWLVLACCFVVIVKSGSRGQFVGFLCIALIFAYYRYPVKRVKGAVAASIVAFGIGGLAWWTLAEFSESERWSLAGFEASGMTRFDMVRVLLGQWYSDLGTIIFGLGNSAAYDPRIIGIYPHFVPLEILAEEGVVGFVLFVSIVVSVSLSIRRTLNNCQEDPRLRGCVVLFGAIFFFDLMLALKQGSLLTHTNLFATAVILSRLDAIVARNMSISAQTGQFIGGAVQADALGIFPRRRNT